MKAKEALETTRLARIERSLREKKKLLDQEGRVLSNANELLTDRIDTIDIDIQEAIAEGHTSIVSSTGGGDIYEALGRLLVVHYQGDGYRANWKVVNVDMGDSAAPGRAEEVHTTISWEDSE